MFTLQKDRTLSRMNESGKFYLRLYRQVPDLLRFLIIVLVAQECMTSTLVKFDLFSHKLYKITSIYSAIQSLLDKPNPWVRGGWKIELHFCFLLTRISIPNWPWAAVWIRTKKKKTFKEQAGIYTYGTIQVQTENQTRLPLEQWYALWSNDAP